jgi:predicted hydrocarbon binding protein
MTPFNWTEELDRDGHRVMLSGQPFAMHCHHYNINLQKTMEDTLGQEGVQLLFRSAEAAAFDSFKYLMTQYDQLKTASTRFEMATLLFQNCGLGVLSAKQLDARRSVIVSMSSHHVTGWLAKHGRRHSPGCHFSRGWIAGVMAAIFERSPGFYDVKEVACKAMLDKKCVFHVEARQWP